MEALRWETAEEINKKLADRVRNIRKRRSISQEKLSRLSGVSHGSVKRFEATGQISLLSLTKIAIALDCADEIRDLFYRDGNGKNPGIKELLAVGAAAGLKKKQCRDLIEQVQTSVEETLIRKENKS